MTEIPMFSHSRIARLNGCGEQARLQYIVGVKGDAIGCGGRRQGVAFLG